MLIEIVAVENEERKSGSGTGSYNMLTVTYKSNGRVAEKKIMSFVNPSVFDRMKGLDKGDVREVTSVKNEKTGYWDWTAVGAEGSAPPPSATASSPTATTRTTGSTYETKEERAVKQRYIVRQSSISNAIASIGKEGLKAKDVIKLAKEYEEYVFGEEMEVVDDDFEDDIPH